MQGEISNQINLIGREGGLYRQKLSSRYLVEKTHYLSSTRRIMSIHSDCVELQSTNVFQDKNEEIQYCTIQSIQCSDHNDKEFSIITTNNTHHTFNCRERGKLLTELQFHFDPCNQKEGGVADSLKTQLQLQQTKWDQKVIHQLDFFYNEESSCPAVFSVHNASIIVSYNLPAEEEEQDRAGENFLQKVFRKNVNKMIDKYQTGKRGSHIIYFIEIDQIAKYDTKMYIIKNNSEVEKFIFQTDVLLNEAVQNIFKNAKAYLNYKIELIDTKKIEENYKLLKESQFRPSDNFDEQQYVINELTLKKNEKKVVIFKTEALSSYWHGGQMPVTIEVTEDSIYMVETQNEQIRTHGYLKELDAIIVHELYQPGVITLSFAKKAGSYIEMTIKAEKKDDLLSAVLCLRSLLNLPNNKLMVFVHKPDYSQQICGFGGDVDPEYEFTQFKKVLDSLLECRDKNEVETKKASFSLNEIILNSNFSNFSKMDQKTIRQFVDEIKECITQYIKLEQDLEDDGDYVDYSSSTESDTDTASNEESGDADEDSRNNSFMNSFASQDSDIGGGADNRANARGLDLGKENEKRQQFRSLSSKLSKLLCLLKLTINSRQLFRELLVDYQDIIHKIIKLMGVQNSYLSYMSSQIIYSLLRFQNASESKAETNNKHELIQGNLSLLKHIKRRLSQHDRYYQEKQIIKSLCVFSLQQLLEAIMCDRKETTTNEDYAKVVTEVFDKKQEFKFLHIIDKFSINEYFWLSLGFTKIFNEQFKFLSKTEIVRYKEMQAYFLVYTVQFIHNIYLLLSSSVKDQKVQSIKLLSQILYKNKYAVQILTRIFKKNLFFKVDTPIELFKTYNWEENDWSQFFNQVVIRNYDTPTEQWNNQIRAEMLDALRNEVKLFTQAQLKHKQVLSDQIRELSHPTHEYSYGNQIVSKVKNLRWNYEKFRVNYHMEQSLIKVSHYYLTKLLSEGDSRNMYKPHLTMVIKPAQLSDLWDELQYKFMPSKNEEEQQHILKVMIIIYQTQYEVVKELRTLPYWLKLLELSEYSECHFLILQLILTCLSVDKKLIADKNYQQFIESDGLTILLQSLNQIFADFQKSGDYIFQLNKISSTDLGIDSIETRALNLKQKNYTDYIQDALFFCNNSVNINIGILVFKILDLIMKKDDNKTMFPLPLNKKIIIQDQHYIAVLSQLLLLQNNQLAKEIIDFVKNHFDSQYAMFQLRYSGLIEFLILYLDGELAEQAFKLLLKIQEVTLDYNKDIDLEKQFDSTDIKYIVEYNQTVDQTISDSTIAGVTPDHAHSTQPANELLLKDSIFLRYLPLPLIKKAHKVAPNSIRDFIDIFQSESYEKATLIWNREMKDILKETIKQNSNNLTLQLIFFAKMQPSAVRETINLPQYEGALGSIIKYPFIENEVRCGLYYLRVWTQQNKNDNNFFFIPVQEENDFLHNLKASLQSISNQDQYKDQMRLIFLLRSCLLALQTFKNKRITCLLEVKQILVHFTSSSQDNMDYNQVIKEILYIGTKTLYTALEKSHSNLMQVLEFDGISIINDVIGLILVHAMKPSSQKSQHSSLMNSINKQYSQDQIDQSLSDMPISIEERNRLNAIKQSQQQQYHSLKVDKLEAKTLLYCVHGIHKLASNNIDKFLEYDLSFRTSLFKQLTYVLDISLQVYKGFNQSRKAHSEKNKNMPMPITGAGSGAATGKSTNNLSLQQSIGSHMIGGLTNQLKATMQLGNIGDSRYYDRNSQPAINIQHTSPSNQYQNNFGVYGATNAVNNIHLSSSAAIINSIDQSYSKQLKRVNQQKQNDNFKLQIDFKNDQQTAAERDIVLKLIFKLAKTVFEFAKEISLQPRVHPEIIQSGFAWKCLQHMFFSMCPETHKYTTVHILLKDSCLTLQHLTSFASLFTQDIKTHKSRADLQKGPLYESNLKMLQNDKEKQIIFEYWFAISRLLERKILENLICPFAFENEHQNMKFNQVQDQSHLKFIKIFSIVEEKTPELIWNEQSRDELSKILQEQLNNIEVSFFDQIQDFDYTVNKIDLRIENIFVKHFNSDIYFKPADANKFVQQLLIELSQRMNRKIYLIDLDEKEFDNVLEITKALRNLVQYQNILNTTNFNFEENIALFCNMIKMKDNDVMTSYQGEQRLKTISSIVFDILKIMSRTAKFSEYLISSLEFAKLVARSMFIGEREIFENEETKKMVAILQNILNYDNLETETFLIKDGIVMFFLHVIFEKGHTIKMRMEIAKLLKSKVEEVVPVVGAFMPIRFFTMQDFAKDTPVGDDDYVVENFLNNLDSVYYENTFVMWNSQLKDQQHFIIKEECERIIKLLNECIDFENFNCNVHSGTFENPIVINEIIISDVIVRIYNKNPALSIAAELDTFLESLCLQLDKQAFCLGQILQILHKNEIDLDAKNEEIIIQVRDKAFTTKQVRKKYRYLFYQTLYALSAVLLTMEQFLYNDFNPNKKRVLMLAGIDVNQMKNAYGIFQTNEGARETNVGGNQPSIRPSGNLGEYNKQQPFYHRQSTTMNLLDSQNQQHNDDVKNIPPFFYTCLEQWLKEQTFSNKDIPIELRLTFLQLIIVTLEVPDIFSRISTILIEYISGEVTRIQNYEFDKTIEEILILVILQKLIRSGGSRVIEQIYSQLFDRIVNIHASKKKLSRIIEYILTLMTKNEQCKEYFQQFSKQQDKESTIQWKDILNPRTNNNETTEAIVRIWRGKPATAHEAKRFYSLNENHLVDKMMDESTITKMKLPLISKKAVEEIKKDEFSEVDKIKISDLVEDLERLEEKESNWERNKEIAISFNI